MTLRYAGWDVDLLACGTIELPAPAIGPEAAGPERVPVMATLLRGHGHTVLVDAGSGPCAELWPGAGGDGLLGALEATGVAPSDVTDVLLTHLDFDHSGGVVAGTWPDVAPAFPSAPVLVAAEGLDAWWSAEARPLNVGTPILGRLRDAGVLATFAEGTEPLPGLRVRSAPGHAHGHTVLEISGEEGVLLHLADAIHARSHVEHTDWDGYYDIDAVAALATRTALIAEAEARGAVVLASHIEVPGRIGRRGGSAAWIDLS